MHLPITQKLIKIILQLYYQMVRFVFINTYILIMVLVCFFVFIWNDVNWKM